MHYGSGRLIDCREGPNVRLSFDGFMVKSKINSWKVDGFALRPDVDNFGFFDNVPDHTVGFWGVYATRPAPQKVSVDVYYLGLDRKQATFERGTAQEVRHSLGARISPPSPKTSRVGTSTTRASGSLAPSARTTFGPGVSRPKPATDFRPCG
jgi:hypothetical protein